MNTSIIALSKRKYQKNYVEKRKTDNGIIRIYDDKHIKQRWKEKVEKINFLNKNIEKLRKKYKEDLKSDDPKVRATAAIVGVIDNTAMRIGNDQSVDEFETFGATTLEKRHATISGNKINFKFKGKKGVAQNLTLTDPAVVSEVKKLLKDKGSKDFIFEYDEGKRIRAKVVNRYLADFDITAKDIRGYHANKLMRDKLKKVKDFDKALDEVADEVGHEAKTLMNQYLDPALVKKYKKASPVFPTPHRTNPDADVIKMVDQILGDKVSNTGPAVRFDIRKERPASGLQVASPFGHRKSPHTGKESFHSGVDLVAPLGTAVLAMADGTVSKSGWQNPNNIKEGFGLRVYINHPKNMTSIYGHLSKILVQAGDNVVRGQIIGYSGKTGDVTGPHLHLELHKDGKPIDPMKLIRST